MKYCPITYEEISDDASYSQRGLKLLSPQLKNLQSLEFDATELRHEAISLMGKMSIQGVQSKVSAQLKVKEEKFELVDRQGHYILKPQSEFYPELPENEAITMTLASTIGLEVPVHGLVYSKNSMTYFIKRFDRIGHTKKIAVEDFTQLSKMTRDIKYNSSMEKVAKIITTYCSIPKLEAVKLFKLTLFNFLTGNEDMHLKNFSLITRDNIVTLSPAYDLLNTTIAQKNTKEEMALPLNGKKSNLRKKDFIEYFAFEQLQLNENVVKMVIDQIKKAIPLWEDLIKRSFLSAHMKEKYWDLVMKRYLQLEM
jgi:serine/threonine-protein kinase HipA